MSHRTVASRRVLPALLALLAAVLVPTPRSAAQVPQPDSLPSFAESPGCGALDGYRGPLAAVAGVIPMSQPVYGPWGDFYGRTKALVHDQIVGVRLPNGIPGEYTKTLYIHERLVPAFEAVVANLEAEAANGNRYRIYSHPDTYEAVQDTDQTWSYSHSTIPPTRKFSFHAVGAAIDVNSLLNPYRSDNVLITNMPAWFVNAWTDAGWCWGGDWQTIKDPMHFSWMGPLFTPGYDMPEPQPPLVAAAAFDAAMAIDVGLTAETPGTEIVADVDRDGAVDVVRLETLPDTGQVTLRAAVARYGFEACSQISVTAAAPADTDAPTFLEDLSADGRPDLVYLNRQGALLQLEIFTSAHAEAMAQSTVTTGIPISPGDVYQFDDHDRDGAIDLYVIRDGDPATMEIWTGPDFATMALEVELGVASAGHRFDVADRDFDGIPDLFAFAADGTLTLHLAADDFAAATPIATGVTGTGELSLHDLDGDGHPDAFVLQPDGSVTSLRGGASTHDPGLWYELTEYGWTPGAGCSDPYPRCDLIPATLIGSDSADRLWGSDGRNVVWAGAGNDIIVTMAGDDLICAGPGDDQVQSGNGKDVIRGGNGNDVLRGGKNNDRIRGGTGDDALYGDRGTRDRLKGGPGRDWLNGGPGTDDRCDIDDTDYIGFPACEVLT
jgi:hypothetical protein